MPDLYVIYHQNCPDGFGAAWAMHQHLRGENLHAQYIPAAHGHGPPPMEAGKPLYIFDFSYSRQVMEALAEAHPLTLLDHHRTAQEELEGLEGQHIEIDTSVSGAHMAWRHLMPERDVPDLVRYIEDRDLWKFQLPNSREVSAALWSHPLDFRVWDQLDTRRLAQEGTPILRHQQRIVEDITAHTVWTQVRGYRIPAVNTPVLQSEVCEVLLKQNPGVPFAGAFYDRDGPDGPERKWSLRSEENFDVSEIARHFGGGGHPQAAGFSTPGRPA